MEEHPIQGLMKTAMENIKDMVDVNKIVGDPVECPDGSVIIPISRVGFGFAAGGSEFGKGTSSSTDLDGSSTKMPFGGGSGGGVSIQPTAFLVVGNGTVKVVPLDEHTHLFDRIIESAPLVVEKIQSMMRRNDAYRLREEQQI